MTDLIPPVPESAAYRGLRVADLSRRLGGAYAARLFGDHGADVALIEPEEGHPLRRESAGLHAYANWNKRSVAAAAARELIASADVVVTTDSPLDAEIGGLLRGDAVHLSVTPHGLTGPLAGAPANDLTINARSGWAWCNGYAEEPPLTLPQGQAGYMGGLAGFLAAAAALRRRDAGGRAELVDVRELEALALTCHPWAISDIYQGTGRSRGPAGGRMRGEPGPLYDAADGKMNFGFGDWHHWQEAMELFNLPEQGAREDLQVRDGRYGRDMSEVQAGVARELAEMERWPLFHRLMELRCIAGCMQSAEQLLENEQLAARRYFVSTAIGGGTGRAPGDAAPLSPPSWSHRRPAPAGIGDGGSGWERDDGGAELRAEPGASAGSGGAPLAGVRVLTFTQAWSGTFCTELLALLGADVVQIESLRRVDIWRNVRVHVPRAIADGSRVQHAQNTQGLFNAVNLNKRGITLDLSGEEGRDLFWRLMPGFDVVVENFRPGVLASWGITLETLAERRPDVILATISGYGHDGPYRTYPANGATTEPMSGLSSLHGYEGDEGMNTAGLYPDPVSGYSAAAAIVAALQRRERGVGPQRLDAAMLEATSAVIGHRVLEADAADMAGAAGAAARPQGNRDDRCAPHGIFRCAGEGEWIALGVDADEQWRALCGLIGTDAASAAAEWTERKAREAEVDAIVGAWAAGRPAAVAERELLGLGIAAAQVADIYRMYSEPDEHLLAAGFIEQVEHAEVGPSWLAGPPWRFSGGGMPALRASPRVGEHSREVLAGELGLGEAELDDLVERGITGTLDDARRLGLPPPSLQSESDKKQDAARQRAAARAR